MDLALITAPKTGKITSGDKYEPTGILYLAAILRKSNHTVFLIDPILEDIEIDQLCDRLLDLHVTLIGLSIMGTTQYEGTLKLVSTLRSRNYQNVIICGGICATFLYSSLMKDSKGQIDYIIRGEGEYALLELVNNLEGKTKKTEKDILNLVYRDKDEGIIVNDVRDNISDLDTLPWMERDLLKVLLENTNNMASIVTGRGCWGNCSFCVTPSFYKLGGSIKVRQRSVVNVVKEIEYLYKKYNVTKYRFYDEVFILPTIEGRKRLNDFIIAIRNLGFRIEFFIMTRATEINENDLLALKEIGLVSICVGVESGSNEELKYMNKGTNLQINEKAIDVLNKVKIPLTGVGCILFGPDTELWKIKDSLQMFKKSNHLTPHRAMNRLTILPGTEIERRLKNEDRLFGDFQNYSYNFIDSSVQLLWDIISTKFNIFDVVETDLDTLKYTNRNNIDEVNETLRDIERQFSKDTVESIEYIIQIIEDKYNGQNQAELINSEAINCKIRSMYEKFSLLLILCHKYIEEELSLDRVESSSQFGS